MAPDLCVACFMFPVTCGQPVLLFSKNGVRVRLDSGRDGAWQINIRGCARALASARTILSQRIAIYAKSFCIHHYNRGC